MHLVGPDRWLLYIALQEIVALQYEQDCTVKKAMEERKNIQDELQRMTSIVKSFTAHIGQLLAGLQQ